MNRDLLPSAVDPTVFDEAFLRQLERLMLVTRKAVRGGMKGVRRSVKRGQSVEFTDYRDYSLGDDLRSLDWNLFARLEKLFIKLFIEEEDVNVHILVDASASMEGGAPDKLLFAKRAAAALAYVGLASYDRVSMAVLQGRVARRFPSVRGTGRVFQVLADPTRDKLLYALAREELCVCDLASIVGRSRPAVSHQLRLLRDLRLVRYRRQGKMAYYSLVDHHIRDLVLQGLRHVDGF